MFSRFANGHVHSVNPVLEYNIVLIDLSVWKFTYIDVSAVDYSNVFVHDTSFKNVLTTSDYHHVRQQSDFTTECD